MNGKDDIIKLIQLLNQYPTYLRFRWENAVLTLLSEEELSVNEISRILNLDYKQRTNMHATLIRMKFQGKVRRIQGRYRLVKSPLDPKQRSLIDFKAY